MATKEKIILVWLKTKNLNLEEWEQKDWREETQSPEKKKKTTTEDRKKDLSFLPFKSVSPFRESQ